MNISINHSGQLGIHMEKIELVAYFIPFIEISLRWFKDLPIIGKTLKLLEENISIVV